MIKLGAIARNDLPTAIAFYAQEQAAGGISPDDSQVLFMLQDDPEDLGDAIRLHLAGKSPPVVGG